MRVDDVVGSGKAEERAKNEMNHCTCMHRKFCLGPEAMDFNDAQPAQPCPQPQAAFTYNIKLKTLYLSDGLSITGCDSCKAHQGLSRVTNAM